MESVVIEKKHGMSGIAKAGIVLLILAVIAAIIIIIVFVVRSRTPQPPAPGPQPPPPTNPNSGLPLSQTPWACISSTVQTNGNNVPTQINANGDIQCMSTDGTNCLWSTPANCTTQASTAPTNLNPVICTASQYTTSGHWCNVADQYYKNNPTPSTSS